MAVCRERAVCWKIMNFSCDVPRRAGQPGPPLHRQLDWPPIILHHQSCTSFALLVYQSCTSLALFLIERIPNFITIFATLQTDKSHDASHVTSAYYILHHYSRTNSAPVLHYDLQFACYFYQLLPFLHHLYLGAQNKTYILVWCYVCVMSISPFLSLFGMAIFTQLYFR